VIYVDKSVQLGGRACPDEDRSCPNEFVQAGRRACAGVVHPVIFFTLRKISFGYACQASSLLPAGQ